MDFPLKPPREWFDVPESDSPQPLTFSADGRVSGHLALWDQCHTGFLNGSDAACVSPPRSADGYSMFHVGQLETEDGDALPVGRIIYDSKHAPLAASMAVAQRHYDDTGQVGAFVRARDGRHGIWLSGAVRSDISPEGFRDLRANPPSGDWRSLNRNLELISALAVPVPGFPIPQMAMAASSGTSSNMLPSALLLEGYQEGMEVLTASAEPRSKEFLRQRSLIASSLVSATLSSKRRNALPRSSFAIPEDRVYPIHDRAHAANALARSAGKPEEGRVRRAVCRRYSDMPACKS